MALLLATEGAAEIGTLIAEEGGIAAGAEAEGIGSRILSGLKGIGRVFKPTPTKLLLGGLALSSVVHKPSIIKDVAKIPGNVTHTLANVSSDIDRFTDPKNVAGFSKYIVYGGLVLLLILFFK